MHRDLRTDTDQLRRLSRALTRALSSLADARTSLADVDTAQLGTKDLDEACDGFQRRWQYGAEVLRDRLGALRDGVSLSHQGYAQVETAVEKAFRAVDTRA
ncbi:hypothetical protein [Streptomyces sp. NPDC047315]|uniref:hypothetical protein n=1 Tax=Streptomyces sp. NPDC047315 TaxID=3155142 RepID=UPI0033CE25BC